MAGGVLKTFGIILIVVGGLVVLTGLGAAVLGGVAFSDAVDDGGKTDCGLFRNQPCDELAEERAEAGAIVGLSGLAGMAVGLVGVIVGIVLLMWGVHRAKAALPPA
jgi:hypothetical protein